MRGTAQAGLRTRSLPVLAALVLVAACTSESPTLMPGGSGSASPSSPAVASGLPSTGRPGGPTTSAGTERPPGATSTPTGTQPSGASPTPSGAPATPDASPTSSTSIDPRVEAALAQLTTVTDVVDQLLFVGWTGTTPESVRETLELLHPGGIVYVGANADQAAEALAINEAIVTDAEELGMLAPFIAIDHEGGSVQRIGDVPNLGSNLAFGNSDPSDQEACQRGGQQAADLEAMAFNMNLAPVLDVLTNPANTVIGDRSYGSDPAMVARLGGDYIEGLQGAGIMAVGKHFPGHGATRVSTHISGCRSCASASSDSSASSWFRSSERSSRTSTSPRSWWRTSRSPKSIPAVRPPRSRRRWSRASCGTSSASTDW